MSTSIFIGPAKPPANTVSGQMYTILSVVCEVDMETGVIIAAEFTVATDLAKDYLNRLLSGRNLASDEDAIIEELEKCYFSGTQKADFLAGVWANRAQQNWDILEPGDVEAALNAASAIGDDRLQQEAQGYVVPDSFTHGTSEQRMRWFQKGLQTGDVDQGDTFSAERL